MLGLYKWIYNILALSIEYILKSFIHLLFLTFIFKNYNIFVIITKAHLISWFEWIARTAWEYLLLVIILCIEIRVSHPYSWASKLSQAIKLKSEQMLFLKDVKTLFRICSDLGNVNSLLSLFSYAHYWLE